MAALLDFEVYNSQGKRVYQKFLDRRSFIAGRTMTSVITWTIPANLPPGAYTVKLGIFNAGWGTLYHWKDRAATFVGSSAHRRVRAGRPVFGPSIDFGGGRGT